MGLCKTDNKQPKIWHLRNRNEKNACWFYFSYVGYTDGLLLDRLHIIIDGIWLYLDSK